MKVRDISGEILTPSWHGWRCNGNGKKKGHECCCDECDFFLICFKEYAKGETVSSEKRANK